MMPQAQNFQRAVTCFQQGRLAEAERLCTIIISVDRSHVDSLHLLGLIALQSGDGSKAVERISRSIGLNPQQPVALMNLSNALLLLGRAEEALSSCDAALALRPDYAEALNNRGNVLLGLRRPADALASYTRAVQLRPDNAVFHCNCGNALRELDRSEAAIIAYTDALQRGELPEALRGRAAVLQALGRHQEALEDLDAALKREPQSAELMVCRGNACFELQRIEEALEDYEHALTIAPGSSEALFNRGNALLKLKRFEDALSSYDECIGRNPDFAKAHYYRGNVLRRLQRPQESLDSYACALRLDAGYADAFNGQGNSLRALGRLTEAMASYEQALRLDPDCTDALGNRGRLLLFLDRPEEAAECLERLFAIAPERGPDYIFALGMLLHARLMCCDWRDFEATGRAIVAAVSSDLRVTLPAMLIAATESPRLQRQCAEAFVDDNWSALSSSAWDGSRYRHSKIHLAYVSADFRDHPVSQLMAGVFEAHDRQRFELIAISLRPAEDSKLGNRVRNAFERFFDVSKHSDQEVAALMRKLEVDVAVDLTGFTDGSRPGIFAYRAAPVQVNYLGYPGTLGARYMDYIIADRTVIPESQQHFYTEHVAYLPHSYLPNDAQRGIAACAAACAAARAPARSDCGLPEQGFVYCCFNSHYKITPAVFDVWMRLLNAVPGAVLWFAAGRDKVTFNLRREASARGVDPQRLVFTPRVQNVGEYLARYRLADLFLDTLPYNAHATACDALWAGLPVLTCRGEGFAGRVAASLLNSVGLPELVANDLSEYENLARQYAVTPRLCASLRARLASNRHSHPFFDTARFLRDLESVYATMWMRHERGDEPAGFGVEA